MEMFLRELECILVSWMAGKGKESEKIEKTWKFWNFLILRGKNSITQHVFYIFWQIWSVVNSLCWSYLLKVVAKISGASQSQAVGFRVAALNEVAGLFDGVFGCWFFRESCRALEELSLEYWHVPRGQRRAEIWSILVRQPDFPVSKGDFGATWKIGSKSFFFLQFFFLSS